jgi:large-conductance mechanosensitive channel
MKFNEFIIENNIMGITIGSIIGFGVTKWTSEIRKNLIVPLIINKYNITSEYGSVVSSSIELLFFIILLFLLFTYVIIPSLEISSQDNINKNKLELKWKKDLLTNIKNISNILVWMLIKLTIVPKALMTI